MNKCNHPIKENLIQKNHRKLSRAYMKRIQFDCSKNVTKNVHVGMKIVMRHCNL